MIVYVLLACISYSGCLTYEFKDKVQCEHTAKRIKKKEANSSFAYCQEVRK